jgi:hypothetical protein
MVPDEDWTHRPPYLCDDDFVPIHRAACFCGAVVIEVRADPVDAKICHCPACQRLHGAPFQWAVIFHKRDVRFVRGVDRLFFFRAETGRAGHDPPCKLSCVDCRSPIADEGRRMFLAFGPLFDFGSPPRVPRSFEPSCHIFYGTRVIDVDDGRPKYLGHKGRSPSFEGGSATADGR